jgi:hypothetical protein
METLWKFSKKDIIIGGVNTVFLKVHSIDVLGIYTYTYSVLVQHWISGQVCCVNQY